MPRVNLVPIEQQHKELRRRYVFVPVAGTAILLIAMGFTYVYLDRQIAGTEDEYNDLVASNAKLAPQMKELEAYEAKQAEKQNRLNNVIELYSQRVRWSRILDDLSFVVPSEVWFDEVEGNVPNLVVGDTETRADQGGTQYDFIVRGYTRDMDFVAIMMVRMGLIPGLKDVMLISAEKEQTDAGTLAIRFEIGAMLNEVSEVQQPAVAPSTGEDGPSDTTTGTTGTIGTTRTTGTSTTGASTTSGGPVTDDEDM